MMPYWIDHMNSGRYYTTFDIEPDPLPGMLRVKAELDKLRPLPGGPCDQDMTLPADAFPRVARESQGRKQLYDYLSMAPRGAVSQEFRDIVEAFEPGVHQFSDEVEVYYKDGRRSEKKYYCMHLRRYLDHTIVPEKSLRVTSKRRVDGGVRYTGTSLPDSFYLDEAAIKGRHFWRSHDMYMQWWMSDEMVKAVKKAKIMGFTFKHQLSGPR